MAISDEISKLQNNLANSYASYESKGATMPSSQNFDNLATTIDSIETSGGSGGGISFPAGTWLLTLSSYSTIEENQLKGAFQNLTSTTLYIGEQYAAGGMYEVKSKGLQEAFKGNTKTTTVRLWGINTFATDSLLDCFLNSSVTTIWFASGTNYTSTTGYSNKWGAPTATIRTESPEPM